MQDTDMCMYVWCAAADTIVTTRVCVSLLGEHWAVFCMFLQYTAWQPVSSSLVLCTHTPWQLRATHSMPAFPARSLQVLVLQWPGRCIWS